MKNRLLAILLAVALIATLFVSVPMTASAETNYLYFDLAYNEAKLFQVSTSLDEGVTGANFLASDYDYEGTCPAWVTWNSATTWTFNYTAAPAVGETFTLKKGNKFTFDSVDYYLDRSYQFKRVDNGWIMTTFDLPADEVNGYIELNSVGYATAGLAQVSTTLPAFASEIDLAPATNGDVYLAEEGDVTVSQIQLYADRTDGLICLQWNSNLTANQSYTIKKGSVIRGGNQVYVLKYSYRFDYDGAAYTLTPIYNDTTFAYHYGTATVIQYSTGVDYETGMANFTTDANGCAVTQSGDQSVGWIGVNDVSGKLVLSFNFNTSFTKGQSYTLAKGSVFVFSAGGDKYVLTDDITLYFNGTDWQTTAPNMGTQYLKFTLGYNTDNLFQVGTNLGAGVTGADFLVSGCDYAGVCPGWVTWNSATTWTFNYTAAPAVGETFTLKKGNKFTFDSVDYYLDRSYRFTRVEGGWVMTAFDLPAEEISGFIELNGVGYATAGLAQVSTTLPTFASEIDITPAADGKAYVDASGDVGVSVIQLYDSRTDGLICLQWSANMAAGQSCTLKKGSLLYAGDKVYALKYGYRFDYDGAAYTLTPIYNDATFSYRFGNATVIQYDTGLDFAAGMANFTTGDNGCAVTQSGDQSVGWIGVNNVENKLVLSFNFNTSFTKGQSYTLAKGSVFAFSAGGDKYALTDDITLYYNGTDWQTTAPVEENDLTLTYRYGEADLIQYNTGVDFAAGMANFTTSDNGCAVTQSGDQSVGWIGADNADGELVLSFHFNGSFTKGQSYTLAKDSLFVFAAGGAHYILTDDITLYYNGTGWQTTEPPADVNVTLSYHYGEAGLIQYDTGVDFVAGMGSFLATDNGSVITQSGDQTVGWIGSDNADGKLVLSFHFNANFTKQQSYTLAKGSVFHPYADSAAYVLTDDITLYYNGKGWQTTEVPADQNITLTYRYGESKLIQYNTGADYVADMVNFTTDEFGCAVTQSGDRNVGYISTHNVDGKLVLGFNFNQAFTKGQSYTLAKDSVIKCYDGSADYIVTEDITLYFNGTDWQDTVPPDDLDITLTYNSYGNASTIQYKTDVDFVAGMVNFTTGDNGCAVTQSGDRNVGWIGVDNADGKLVMTFHFNEDFTAGQSYTLSKDSVFRFFAGCDNYILTEDITLYYNGYYWQTTVPVSTTPFNATLRGGTSEYVQFDTTLPATTQLAGFLATSSGFNLLQGGTRGVGWVGMDNDNGTIVLTFHFAQNTFSKSETYTLSAGSVFGLFEAGSATQTAYVLDNNMEVVFTGEIWILKSKLYADSEVFADANGDNQTNVLDLVCMKKVLAAHAIENNQCDLNHDGLINAEDLIIMRKQMLGIYNPAADDFTAEEKQKLATANFNGGGAFAAFADVPVDARDSANIADYTALGLNTAILTEDYTGKIAEAYRVQITKANEQTVSNPLTLTYTGYTNGTLVQFSTNLPTGGSYANFLLGDQQVTYSTDNTDIGVAWVQCAESDGVVYMNPVFADYHEPGDTFTFNAGSTFTFGTVTYTLDADYTITFANDYVTSLKNLKAAGLKVLVRNYTNKADYFSETNTKILKKYADLIDGFYLNDEPFETDALQTASGQTAAASFAGINTMIDWVNTNFAGKFVHVNHVPITSYDHYTGTQSIANYKSFLSGYLTGCVDNLGENSAASLSLDSYPFGDYTKTSGYWIFQTTTQGLSSSYLQSVLSGATVARDYAGSKNVVMTNCVQTFTDSSNSSRTVNADEISFQLYTSMAMGVRQYEYFTYKSVGSITGMLDADSQKTSVYNAALAANKALAFGDVLNTMDWQGTALSNGTANNANAATFASVADIALTTGTDTGVLTAVTSSDDAIIGYYKAANGNDAYMVANYNDPHDVTGNNTVTLTFTGCTAARVYTISDGALTSTLVKLSNGTYTANVAPGSGFLVIPA